MSVGELNISHGKSTFLLIKFEGSLLFVGNLGLYCWKACTGHRGTCDLCGHLAATCILKTHSAQVTFIYDGSMILNLDGI